MRAVTTFLLVAAVGIVAGCSAVEPSIPVGTCLEATVGEDADFTSIVGCDEPHRYGVVGTATWPDMDEAIDLDGAEFVWDEISALRLTAYWDWADEACQQSFRESQGLDSLMIDGNSGDDLTLNMTGRFYIDMSLPARDAFVEGDTATLCSIGWLDPEGERTSLAFAPDTDIRDFVSGEIGAIEAYSCFDRLGQGDQPDAECSEPHNGEYLLLFDGGVGLSADFIESFDPVTTTAPDYSELDEFCETLIGEVYPGVLDDGTWKVWGDHLLSFGGGWDGFDGTFDPDERYMFYCGVLRSADDSVTGSVVLGDIVSVAG